ncbi:biotin/lipoyl-binding protein [Patescibacteria group bacterium]
MKRIHIKKSKYRKIFTNINNYIIKLYKFFHSAYKKITRLLLTKPEKSFITIIFSIFILIIIGSIINKPDTDENVIQKSIRSVNVFSVGKSPRLNTTAKIEKSGVIKIVAQTPGIIQKIYHHEGSQVSRGNWLFWLSNNYQGGTISTVARQIAQKNFDFVDSVYDTQKNMISSRRDIADKIQGQTDKLRNIVNDSLEDTRTTVSFNENLLSSLEDQITYLESTNVNHANDALILQANQGKAGILAALSSLKNALKNAEYQASSENEPAKLSQIQKDLTLKQLDIEEKSLDLNRELSRLNLQISQITESLMYPVSPVLGIVERVHVQVGQNVNPGQVLATITGKTNHATAVVNLPENIASKVSLLEKSKLFILEVTLDVLPLYISSEPTENGTNTVLFSIPDEYAGKLSSGQFITVEIPVGSVQSTNIVPYVPLDSVYQTKSESYIFVAKKLNNNEFEARTLKVELGRVYGSFVEVTEGLEDDTQIIINRNVTDGEKISIKN